MSKQKQILVVIATYNGGKTLADTVASYRKYDAGVPIDIVIVDNQSDAQKRDHAVGISKLNKAFFLDNLTRGFDTGAYRKGFENYPDYPYYLFIQDDLSAVRPGWGKLLLKKLKESPTGTGVVALGSFGNQQTEDKEYWGRMESFLKELSQRPVMPLPPLNIFGPMFFATNATMLMAKEHHGWNMRIANKDQQESMERGWAIMFEQLGIGLVALAPFTGPLVPGNHEKYIPFHHDFESWKATGRERGRDA